LVNSRKVDADLTILGQCVVSADGCLPTIQTIVENVYVWLLGCGALCLKWTLSTLTRNLLTYLLTYGVTTDQCASDRWYW